MEINVPLWQVIAALLAVVAPQLYNIWKANKDAAINAPLTKAQAEGATGQALETLSKVYQQSLATIASQDEELATLRPLILQIAILQQQCGQTQRDKDDWKVYAEKMKKLCEDNGILPPAFVRQSLEMDSDKMRAATQLQIEKYTKSIGNKKPKKGNGNGDATIH